MIMKIKRFWSDGLDFSCTRCGKCCCGEPGIVYFNPEEFDRLTDYLKTSRNIDRETIIREYMVPFSDSYTARDDFPDGHCAFFDKGCTVYEVRPSQCRDFPFWRCNLSSLAAWNETAARCPGIGQGKHHSGEEIAEIARKSRI